MTCVPRLQDSAKKAKSNATGDNARKRTRDSAEKHSDKKKVEQSKSTKESKESKGASHQKPSMAKESPDTQHEKSNDEKRALNKFMKDLKKLNSGAEPRKITVKGVMGESTAGCIGFTCTFGDEEQERIVHETEIGEDEKRDFALAVARWIRDDRQAKHKAGVVRALDLMLDYLLGKSDVPRLEALFNVQEPRGRNSTFRCSIAHPSHIRTKKKKTPRARAGRIHDTSHVENDTHVDDEGHVDDDTPCMVCNLTLCEDEGAMVMLLCETCTNGAHVQCCKLHSVPDGDWICSTCKQESKEASLKRRKVSKDSEEKGDAPSIAFVVAHSTKSSSSSSASPQAAPGTSLPLSLFGPGIKVF
jgi:hypothetical protein